MPPRRIDVAPERFSGWITSFSERHGGGLAAEAGGESALFRAADGATASCEVPFPPFAAAASLEPAALADAITAHACAPRTVGVLLVRLGGYAAGVFTGSDLTAFQTDAVRARRRLVAGDGHAGIELLQLINRVDHES